jgi:hypothetical protein
MEQTSDPPRPSLDGVDRVVPQLAIPLGNPRRHGGVQERSCESVRWSFAPLLATCEPTTAQLTAYGWFGTALVLTLFASATGIAAAGIARSGALAARNAPTPSTSG